MPRRRSGCESTRRAQPISRLALLVLAALLAAGCTVATPLPSVSPTRAPDIQRGKLDIVYSGMLQGSYFKPSGKDILGAALEAMKKLARDSGGTDDVATPDLDGSQDAMLSDFRKFAAAAEALAAKNQRVQPSRFGDVGIRAMLAVTPDCHTYYVPPRGGSSRPNALAAPPPQNVRFQLLPGGVGYVAWTEFDLGTFDEVQKAMDQLLAQGAKTWLFDLRGNRGGEPPQSMASWFIKDGVLWRDVDRDGKKIDVTAKSNFYLPAQYQLPLALVIDGHTGSSPEFLTVALQQRGRAKVFGTKSAGCLGGILPVNLPDGSFVAITESVSIGVKDTPINGVGIVPDVEVRGGDPVGVAAQYLRSVGG